MNMYLVCFTTFFSNNTFRANPRNFHFDDLQSAFVALFEILSLEGYNDVRDIMIDATKSRVGAAAAAAAFTQ